MYLVLPDTCISVFNSAILYMCYMCVYYKYMQSNNTVYTLLAHVYRQTETLHLFL